MNPIIFGKYKRLVSKVVRNTWQTEDDEIETELLNSRSNLITRFRYMSRFKALSLMVMGVVAFAVVYTALALISCYLGAAACYAFGLASIAFLVFLTAYLYFGSRTSWNWRQRFRFNTEILKEDCATSYLDPKEVLEKQLEIYSSILMLYFSFLVMPFLATTMSAFLDQVFWKSLTRQFSLSLAWQANESGTVALIATIILSYIGYIGIFAPFFWMRQMKKELVRMEAA